MARGVNTKANGIDFRANRFDEFLKLIPQNLTDAEKAQVMANLGITPTPGSLDGAVRYDAAQTLTSEQKEQAIENIGASPVVSISQNTQTGGYDIQVGSGSPTNVAGQEEVNKALEGHISLTPDNNFGGAQHYKDGYQIYAGPETRGSDIDDIRVVVGANFRNILIPLNGARLVKFNLYRSTALYGMHLLNSDMESILPISSTENAYQTLPIVQNAAYLLFSYSIASTLDPLVELWYVKKTDTTHIEERVAELSSSVDGDSYKLEQKTDMLGFLPYEIHSYGQVLASSSSIGVHIDSIGRPTEYSKTYVNYLIPISEIWGKVKLYQYASTVQYGSLFLNADKVVVGVISKTGTHGEVEKDIPSGTAYICYSVHQNYTSENYIELLPKSSVSDDIRRIDSRIDDISVSSGGSVTGLSPKLRQGYLSDSGALVEDTHYLTTDAINGAFLLELNDGYKMYYVSMFDRTGNLVSDHYFKYDVGTPIISDRYFTTDAKDIQEVTYKVVIRREDSGVLSANENVIKRLVILKDAGLHRYIPEDLPNYDKALLRINAIENVMWTPLADVPAYSKPTLPYYDYYRKGNRFYGLPYSDVADIRKYVPQNVSFYTFLSAVHNKRSLLYTENVDASASHSEYGNTYYGSACKSYFGAVCSSLTGFVLGLRRIYLSGSYHNNGVPGLTTVSNPTAETLRPLDLYWKDGHITIISDIYKDDFGNVKFIVVAEQSIPLGYRTIYTPEEFFARMESQNGEIHRYSGWDNITFDEDIRDYIKCGLGDVQQNPKFNDDICTFAGDYATFEASDKIFLNCRRAETYTAVNIYKDGSSTPYQTIDISSLPADTIYDDGEDWVRVDLTGLLTYGKYTAALTDGTDTTEPTHWEVISLEFSATREGSNVICTFSCDAGTLDCIDNTHSGGFPSRWHDITSEEASAGTCTINWAYSSTDKWMHLIAQGDYGTAIKKIGLPE